MSGLVFAGAFNPPTVAHTRLARIALEQTGSEYVTFVPSKQSYIRDSQKKSFAISDEQRLGFLHRLAESRTWMRVSDIELRQNEQPRTYLTLKALREKGLSKRTREYCMDMRSSGRSLLHIINDVLDFSRIEAGKLSITDGFPTGFVRNLSNLSDLRFETIVTLNRRFSLFLLR